MRWVTKEKVSYERIGSAWLISRFIDPQAEFAFVPDGTDASQVKDGTPFHLENAELRKEDGKGTFQVILDKYELAKKHPALERFAPIFTAAYGLQVAMAGKSGKVGDHVTATTPPEAAGLRMAVQGARARAKSDLEILDAGGAVLDAFYAGTEH